MRNGTWGSTTIECPEEQDMIGKYSGNWIGKIPEPGDFVTDNWCGKSYNSDKLITYFHYLQQQITDLQKKVEVQRKVSERQERMLEATGKDLNRHDHKLRVPQHGCGTDGWGAISMHTHNEVLQAILDHLNVKITPRSTNPLSLKKRKK
jgi:hypothetical protein